MNITVNKYFLIFIDFKLLPRKYNHRNITADFLFQAFIYF